MSELDLIVVVVSVAAATSPAVLAVSERTRPLGVALFIGLIPLYIYQKTWLLSVPGFPPGVTWPPLLRDLVCAALVASVAPTVFRKHLIPKKVAFAAASIYALIATGIGLADSVSSLAVSFRTLTVNPATGVFLGAYVLSISHSERDRIVLYVQRFGGVAGLVALMHAAGSQVLVLPFMKYFYNGRPIDWNVGVNRLRSVSTHPNVLAYEMVLLLFACLVAARTGRQDRRLWAYGLAVMSIVVVALTGSRSGVIGAFVAVLVGLGVFTYRERLKLLYSGAAATALALSAFPLWSGRFDDLADNPRLLIWRAHLDAVAESPTTLLFGTGPGSAYRAGGLIRQSSVVVSGLDGVVGGDSNQVNFLDSVFVQYVFEFGFVGLIFCITLLGLGVAVGRRSTRMQRGDFLARIGPLMVVAILVWSFFSSAAVTYPWDLLFWFFVTVVLSNRRLGAPSSESSAAQTATSRPAPNIIGLRQPENAAR